MSVKLLSICMALLLVFAATVCAEETAAFDWESVYQEHVSHVTEEVAKYPPRVTTLSNGVQVQRTPADGKAINTKLLDADARGCLSCHNDLAKLVNDYDLLSTGKYQHFGLVNDLGIEITYQQCLLCHTDSTSASYDKMGMMMHAIHNGGAFAQMGGTCWSCHYADENTGDMVIWDEVKYSVLKNVSKVANVQGAFSYDQDKTTDLGFNIDWMYDNDPERMATYRAGFTPDPENDGRYDSWTITVSGEVEKEMTFTLRELIENGPKVTKISKAHCTINPNGGPLVANVEVTGIPFSYLTNQAGIKSNANVLYNGSLNNMSYAQRVLAELDLDDCLLVYEVNGKPLSHEWGYPVISWFNGMTCATENRKQITHLIFAEEDVSAVTPMPTGRINKNGDVTNNPNMGFMNVYEGQIIPVSQPFKFEGYADGFDKQVIALEFSMDLGKTWTSFDVSDSNQQKLVFWNFEWTPEKAGSYVLTIRCKTEDGATCFREISKLVTAK